MSDRISVDTDQLGVAIPQVHELAARINVIRSTLNGTLEGLGDCWGGKDDAIGGPFEESYVPARDQIDLGVLGTGEVLDSTATGLHTMVRGYEQTEEANTISVPRTPVDTTPVHTTPDSHKP